MGADRCASCDAKLRLVEQTVGHCRGCGLTFCKAHTGDRSAHGCVGDRASARAGLRAKLGGGPSPTAVGKHDRTWLGESLHGSFGDFLRTYKAQHAEQKVRLAHAGAVGLAMVGVLLGVALGSLTLTLASVVGAAVFGFASHASYGTVRPGDVPCCLFSRAVLVHPQYCAKAAFNNALESVAYALSAGKTNCKTNEAFTKVKRWSYAE